MKNKGGRPRVNFERSCLTCGEVFLPREKTTKYCSQECSIANAPHHLVKNGFEYGFFQKEDYITAYWAGLLLADGYVEYRGRSTSIGLTLDNKDEDHLHSFLEVVNAKRKLLYVNQGCKVVRITSPLPDFKNDLQKWGIIPNKTYDLVEIPPLWNDPSLTPHLIRGMWDGDGSFWTKRYGGCSFVSHHIITDWMTEKITKSGILVRSYLRSEKILPNGRTYRVCSVTATSKQTRADLCEWLGYNEIDLPALPRKRTIAQTLIQEGRHEYD